MHVVSCRADMSQAVPRIYQQEWGHINIFFPIKYLCAFGIEYRLHPP